MYFFAYIYMYACISLRTYNIYVHVYMCTLKMLRMCGGLAAGGEEYVYVCMYFFACIYVEVYPYMCTFKRLRMYGGLAVGW